MVDAIRHVSKRRLERLVQEIEGAFAAYPVHEYRVTTARVDHTTMYQTIPETVPA